MQDLLSQDEIDALLHGVDESELENEFDGDPGSVRPYDLTSQDRICLLYTSPSPRDRG